jgi:hypothetical protein
MAQGRRLTAEQVRQVEALVDGGVAQQLVADVLHISRRSVTRTLARRRVEPAEPTLAEVLAPFAGDDYDPIAFAAEPSRQKQPRRRRRDDWELSARQLEATAPERWALPGGAGDVD